VRELWIGVVLIAAVPVCCSCPRSRVLTRGVGDSGLFLFLNAVIVILILVLIFVVTAQLLEARRRAPARDPRLAPQSQVRRRVRVIALVTTRDCSSSRRSSSRSRSTSGSASRSTARSRERRRRQDYYESTAESANFYGSRIAEYVADGRLLREGAKPILEDLVQQKQREYNLGVVEIYGADGDELVSGINPEIPRRASRGPTRPRARGAARRSALARRRGRQRRRRARRGADRRPRCAAARTRGAVVVNVLIPFSQARKVASIRSTLDAYRQLQPTAGHIRTAYLLELLLAFSVVLMLALWMGFRLAKGVTGPIRALAEGTAEVARGNLDVRCRRRATTRSASWSARSTR
jgi:two-component system nitrogen regulation sensor histidine kinase NtrY